MPTSIAAEQTSKPYTLLYKLGLRGVAYSHFIHRVDNSLKH